MENFLIKLLCGVRKSHSTQYVIFRLPQKWEAELGLRTGMRGGCAGITLMNLSKPYECLSHHAKLKVYIGNLDALLDYMSLQECRI